MPKSLSQLIKAAKLDYVNTDVTAKNFPGTSDATEFELVHYGKYITTEEVIADLYKRNLRPATMYELAHYANNGWDRKTTTVALGSVWAGPDGDRRVGCLWSDSAYRSLSLLWFDAGAWRGDYRFLAIKSSDSKTLSTPALEPLDCFEIDGQRYELASYGPPYSDGSRQATIRLIQEQDK